MDLQLQGRRAIVTGGSSGIGRAVARQLALEGCRVAVVARSAEPLAQAAAALRAETGGEVLAVPADTTRDTDVTSAVEDVVSALGGVDILVNAAASPGSRRPVQRLAQIEGDHFLDAMNVKVQGYVRCAQACAPHLLAQGWGRIINISGLTARATGSPITSMRNAAVVALTKSLADELGPGGVNVTVVHPGLTRTERTAATIAARAAALGVPEAEVEAEMSSRNSLRRLVTAEEVADVVAFLASPRSVAINGDVIAAGGGVGSAIYY